MTRYDARLALTLLLFLLLGCARSSAPSASIPAEDAPPPTEGTAQALSPTVAQTLVMASGAELGPGNPHDYSTSRPILDLVYEPLVRYDEAGTIQPALAERWEISEDGRTWTFSLRPNVTFHDGTPLDAAAVKWNLERWVGQARHGWLPAATRITAIETPDSETVVLTMRDAYYPAVQDLTLIRPVRFLSPNAVNSDGDFQTPIGTGPWRLLSLDAQQATLVPHDAYWGARPRLEKIMLEVILDPQTRMAALLSGEVDVIGGEYLGGISLESLPVLARNPGLRILTGEGITSFYLATDYATPPFDDQRVRRAIALAIDKQALAARIFDGHAGAATGLLPDGAPYVSRTGDEIYGYDPARARELLAEAGWTPGTDGIVAREGVPFTIDLVVDRSRVPQTVLMAEVIQAQLKEVGIQLEIRAYDYSGWLDAYKNRDYDLQMRFSWGPPYDPHTVLTGSFFSGAGEESAPSYTHPDLDRLIEQVLVTTDEGTRQALYDQIWQHLDGHAAVIPLLYPPRVYAHGCEVVGFRLGGTEYDFAYAVQQVEIVPCEGR